MPRDLHNLRIQHSLEKSAPIEEIDSSMTAAELLNELSEKINLPSGTRGTLIRKSTGQIIPSWQTLAEAGVQNDEVLLADFERVAGAGDILRDNKYPWGDSFSEGQGNLATGYNLLTIKFSLPSFLTLDEFFGEVVDGLRAIEAIYSIFAIVFSGNSETINSFSSFLKDQRENETVYLSNPLLQKYMASANLEPLRLKSVSYGSPASFDLLGLGKILEILRDSIKDLSWRGKHEKLMADLERKEKQLELEKTTSQIRNEKLETEKLAVEIINQKIQILEKIGGLSIADDEKKLLVSTLVPKMVNIAHIPVTSLLKTEGLNALPPSKSSSP